jgi:hypothetical protein
VEYRGVWLIFFALVFLFGMTASILPGRVIKMLRQAATAPADRYVLGFRVLGGAVAIGCIAELISIIEWGHLL